MLLSTGERWFNRFNLLLMLLLALAMLLPFLNVIAKSLSSNSMVMAGEVSLWPKEFNLYAYNLVFKSPMFMRSIQVTVFITLAGTLLTLFVVITSGYALSKKRLLARRTIMLYFLFTMFFSAGMIPGFLNIQRLGIYDTLWALILPGLMNVYYMLLVKSFFEQLPSELEESASLDGCHDIQILTKIFLPISKPIVATIGLFAAVHFWNIYVPAVMYIQSPKLYPLQVLNQMLIFAQSSIDSQHAADQDMHNMFGSENLKMAVIVVSTMPIVIVYPFLQKYFVKGVTLGAIKS